jgi:Uma2 family endonuclease
MEPITQATIVYPSFDGKPMADNTKQFNWITLIKSNLEAVFVSQAAIFVAGDLLWYPVEGQAKICTAPDVLVVFGVAKKDRKSFIQHQENNIPPQVVFEIISDSNRQYPTEMVRKFRFYEDYGVEEYFVIDPDTENMAFYLRKDNRLEEVGIQYPFQSPRLQITFDRIEDQLKIYYPNGLPFESLEEARLRAANEKKRAETERFAKEKAFQKLRELGINPEDL